MTISHRLRHSWNRTNGLALAILGACLLICGGLALESTPNVLNPSQLENILQQLGALGSIVYMAVLALSVVISPIPGAPLAVVGGMVWGMPLGGIYSVGGGFLGSLLAYWIGRTLGHSAIQALTGKSIYLTQNRGDRTLGWLIFLSRLLPVFPFDVLSYGAGIARLPLNLYAPATLLGMILPTFLLAYTGRSLTTTPSQLIAVTGALLVLLVGLPWIAHRYNWFNVGEIIRFE